MAGREVAVSNPDKIFFPELGLTKIDLVRYYLAVADGALRGVDGRPMALKRFVNGADGEFFFQKRAPSARPDWIETVELKFPSGRTAHEIVVRDAAQLTWIVNLGCIDLNPHPVRADDLDHPDAIVLDLMMPEVTGHDVLAALRDDAADEDVPILVLTAVTQSRERERCLAEGADKVMTKPFDPREVATVVDGMLNLPPVPSFSRSA